MKKLLSVFLAFVLVIGSVAFCASAKDGSVTMARMTISKSRPYVGLMVSIDKGTTVVATARGANGMISVPKGGHVEWFALTCGGKVSLKPINGGRQCELRGIRPGVTYVFAFVFNANNVSVATSGASLNVQTNGVFKVVDDILKWHSYPYFLMSGVWIGLTDLYLLTGWDGVWNFTRAIGSI